MSLSKDAPRYVPAPVEYPKEEQQNVIYAATPEPAYTYEVPSIEESTAGRAYTVAPVCDDMTTLSITWQEGASNPRAESGDSVAAKEKDVSWPEGIAGSGTGIFADA